MGTSSAPAKRLRVFSPGVRGPQDKNSTHSSLYLFNPAPPQSKPGVVQNSSVLPKSLPVSSCLLPGASIESINTVLEPKDNNYV